MILMLSDNLKHVLYESNSDTVSLEKELQFLDNYIEFQRIRTEGVKTIDYKKEIDALDHQIAPLLLITIFENAFKHSTLKGEISIDLRLHKGVLECICKNDFDSKKVTPDDFKIGLQNLAKRLQLIYKNKHEFKISKNDQFKVYLKITL